MVVAVAASDVYDQVASQVSGVIRRGQRGDRGRRVLPSGGAPSDDLTGTQFDEHREL
jgi:hypothetical protein